MTSLTTMMRNLDPTEPETTECICQCGRSFMRNKRYGGTRVLCDECLEEKNSHRTNRYYKHVDKKPTNPVIVQGYRPVFGIDLADYTDFKVGTQFDFEEVKQMVYLGTFTPGVILQRAGTPPVIVVGEGENQRIEVMTC